MNLLVSFLFYAAAGLWLVMMVMAAYCVVMTARLRRRLKNYHADRFIELKGSKNAVFRSGYSFRDYYQTKRYIDSDLDDEDINIVRLKKSIKAGIRYIGFLFIALLCAMAAAVIVMLST